MSLLNLFGGGDSSSSSTNTTTNNTDRRQVVDGGSVGVSSDSSTVNVTSLDAGAIAAGTNVALASVASNSTNVDHLLAAADKLFAQQQAALDMNTNLTKSLASTTQAAYQDAAANAQGNKPIMYAVIAVIGIAAVNFMGKKA